ncbi:MAG: hypothetical protein QOE86_2535, partial [Solirubrobacteraceae bacterium]|nr:hypothetical protein [Solirubrobacteraceae bacterium]
PELRVALTATRAEGEAVVRLRYRQVVDDGWARADRFPDGLERDEWDADALQIGAWSGTDLVGAMRIVLPAPGRRLPVEVGFGVDVEPAGRVVEAGRLVIDPDFRGDPAHRAWGGLFARAWLELRARGFRVLAGAASPEMVARLRGVGLPFEVLGPERPHWGLPRLPVRLDPAESTPTWFAGGLESSGRWSRSPS